MRPSLDMIEVDQPGRRFEVRAPDGVDWCCTYPDDLHPVVTTLIARLVRVEGSGRRLSATTGHLRIERIEAVAEHVQDVLFTLARVSVEELRSEQGFERSQGIAGLIDEAWEDDDESRRFLEATLGPVPSQWIASRTVAARVDRTSIATDATLGCVRPSGRQETERRLSCST